jgi:hypothetical protein
MTKFINKSFVLFIGLSLSMNIASTQQTPDQALEACMNKTMVQSAAGGAIGWQNSWKSCTESINVVTINNLQTEDYKKTAERLGYSGQGVLFKIEGLGVSQEVIAGNKLNASLKFVLLKPEPAETSVVQISRSWVCGSSEITIKPEIFTVAQGTIIQDGKVQIPSVKPDVGPQQCEMTMKIAAEGQSYQVKRPFTIQPG